MSLQNESKLKLLHQLIPEGIAVSASFLEKHSISRQLRYKYVQNQWLFKKGSFYSISNESISWEGVVVGLQKFENRSFSVGGLKSLEIQGFAHYLPIGDEKKITLYGEEKLPRSLDKVIGDGSKIFLKRKPDLKDKGLTKIPTKIKEFTITISTPERAILELLYLTEKEGVTFTFVGEIFENLTTLRPNVLNELLSLCKSKKVKRLFSFFSHFYNHQWSRFIDFERVDCGKGKIQIVKKGELDKNFQITIPKGFYDGQR
ncbi:MAG: type IV toxin-antitoxin system AbiEi family antitoxin [Campylobacterales bacterium]|nr:type IV toxin-antitoxin system AbiEi family antitoxin [Campylobacterales bacterium]